MSHIFFLLFDGGPFVVFAHWSSVPRRLPVLNGDQNTWHSDGASKLMVLLEMRTKHLNLTRKCAKQPICSSPFFYTNVSFFLLLVFVDAKRKYQPGMPSAKNRNTKKRCSEVVSFYGTRFHSSGFRRRFGALTWLNGTSS